MSALATKLERILERLSRRDRRPAMLHVVESVQEVVARFSDEIEAIETGTIRSYTEEHESTRHIATALGNRGSLTSVDSSPEAIEVSRAICRGLHNVDWVQSDSISYLSALEGRRFHFAFLDSANDEDVIFEEFRLVAPRMVEGGIVMVDDAGITSTLQRVDSGRQSMKGRRVWRFLRSCGAEYDVLRTPGAHGTQLRIRFDPANAARILAAV